MSTARQAGKQLQANVTFLLHAAVVVIVAGVVVAAAGVDVVAGHLVLAAGPAHAVVRHCGSEQLQQRSVMETRSNCWLESMRMRGGVTHSRN